MNKPEAQEKKTDKKCGVQNCKSIKREKFNQIARLK